MTLFYKAIARVLSHYLDFHIAVIASHFDISLVVKSDCAVKDECCFFPILLLRKVV